MKILKLIITVIIVVFLTVLAVNNRILVTMYFGIFTDDTWSLTLPLYIFLFISLFAGLIIGGLIVWLGNMTKNIALRREIKELKSKIKDFQG